MSVGLNYTHTVKPIRCLNH